MTGKVKLVLAKPETYLDNILCLAVNELING